MTGYNSETTSIVNNANGAFPDGVQNGAAATDLNSFYGKTPIVQPAATAQSAVPTTAITTLVTTPTATDIATAVNSLIARVAANTTLNNSTRTALVDLGLMKGAA